MIDESGAVIPDIDDVDAAIDAQFKEKAQKEHLICCGQCNFVGNWEQMEFHKLGQHGSPN